MNKLSNFLVSSTLLCLSPLTLADCDDPAAPDDCIVITPDDNDSMGDTGGGGIIYDGGSGGGSQGVGTGNGGGDTSGQGEDNNGGEEPQTKEECLADVEVTYTRCRYIASQAYDHYHQEYCVGLGTTSGGLTSVVSATQTYNSYEQCKNDLDAGLRADYDGCTYYKSKDTILSFSVIVNKSHAMTFSFIQFLIKVF